MALQMVSMAAVAVGGITLEVHAQDECATALPLATGVPLPFDTTVATPSANPPSDDSCPGT